MDLDWRRELLLAVGVVAVSVLSRSISVVVPLQTTEDWEVFCLFLLLAKEGFTDPTVANLVTTLFACLLLRFDFSDPRVATIFLSRDFFAASRISLICDLFNVPEKVLLWQGGLE